MTQTIVLSTQEVYVNNYMRIPKDHLKRRSVEIGGNPLKGTNERGNSRVHGTEVWLRKLQL